MDLFAYIFGAAMILLSILVAYHWGIKPDRQAQKRRAEQALAEMRQQRHKRSHHRTA